jgi:secreted Zn-dependent insulinase-like peptidase
MGVVKGVLDYEPRLCLAADSLFTEYDADEIVHFLALMTPQNSRVRIVAKAVGEKCDKSEPWCGSQSLFLLEI